MIIEDLNNHYKLMRNEFAKGSREILETFCVRIKEKMENEPGVLDKCELKEHSLYLTRGEDVYEIGIDNIGVFYYLNDDCNKEYIESAEGDIIANTDDILEMF